MSGLAPRIRKRIATFTFQALASRTGESKSVGFELIFNAVLNFETYHRIQFQDHRFTELVDNVMEQIFTADLKVYLMVIVEGTVESLYWHYNILYHILVLPFRSNTLNLFQAHLNPCTRTKTGCSGNSRPFYCSWIKREQLTNSDLGQSLVYHS